MKEKIRVGIVGSKFAADFHADSYTRNPRVAIAAVAAIDNLEPFAEKWNIPRTYADYKDMLAREELDLVSICAPNFLHHDIAVAAARAGKHVFCEKPLATTAADAQETARTQRQQIQIRGFIFTLLREADHPSTCGL